MSPAPGWRRLLRLSLGKQSVERDVDDELAFHIAMREEKLRRLGVGADDAHTQARERFGDPDKFRDECITIDTRYAREVHTMEWLESLWADVRYAFRTLRRMPAFTAVAVLTLALGIGATTAMFTLVNGILLRPLPYPNADRLVRLVQSYPEKGLDTWGVSQQNIAFYRDRGSDFEAFAGYRGGTVTLTGSTGAERLTVTRVTADFFKVMGIHPAIGREFTRDEDTPGKNNFAVMSYGLWQTRFGGDPKVVGSTLNLDGTPVVVLGVMPPDFSFPRPEVKLWMAMGLDPNRFQTWTNTGIGRLKSGVSVEHAERQTTAIMWDWARTRPNFFQGMDPARTRMKTIVQPLRDAMTGRTAKPLAVLLAAVGLILLIAIANVATLLSSRAAARQREIGLRAALGATGSRVVRQLLTESIALALVGAVVGVGFAYAAVRAFTHSTLATLPRIDEVQVDLRVLAFTFAASLISGVLFGLLPAASGAKASLTSELKAGQRESAQRSARRVNNALVVAQLSLSVILLVAAGLVLKSFQRLMHTDLGYRPEGVTSIALQIPQTRVASAPAASAFYSSLLNDVRAVPGVKTATLAWSLPFEGNSNYDGLVVEGRTQPEVGMDGQTYQTAVSPAFFSTVGIPLLYGRDFTPSDDSMSTQVAIINETLAKKYWNGAEALGKRLRNGGDPNWSTVIGVVGSAREGEIAKVPEPHIYSSLPQQGGNRLSLGLRIDGDPARVIPAVRQAIMRIEPAIPLDVVRPLSSFVDQSLATRRLTQILLGAFAVIAVFLAAVGIYGVMSLSVASRNREFGVRLAVGAEPGAVVRLVLREGATIAALGVGIGVVGALAATRWLTGLLYGVSATDPVVFVSLSAALGAIAVASCWLPARRAARSDPLAVLRAD